jgi:hypothetical protein
MVRRRGDHFRQQGQKGSFREVVSHTNGRGVEDEFRGVSGRFWDGKIKRRAVGWAYVVGLIDVLCHPLNTPCHTFLGKPQLNQRSERHPPRSATPIDIACLELPLCDNHTP